MGMNDRELKGGDGGNERQERGMRRGERRERNKENRREKKSVRDNERLSKREERQVARGRAEYELNYMDSGATATGKHHIHQHAKE